MSYAAEVRLGYKERHGPTRTPGFEHRMKDGTGRTFVATIIASTPIAEGWVEYELET